MAFGHWITKLLKVKSKERESEKSEKSRKSGFEKDEEIERKEIEEKAKKFGIDIESLNKETQQEMKEFIDCLVNGKDFFEDKDIAINDSQDEEYEEWVEEKIEEKILSDAELVEIIKQHDKFNPSEEKKKNYNEHLKYYLKPLKKYAKFFVAACLSGLLLFGITKLRKANTKFFSNTIAHVRRIYVLLPTNGAKKRNKIR